MIKLYPARLSKYNSSFASVNSCIGISSGFSAMLLVLLTLISGKVFGQCVPQPIASNGGSCSQQLIASGLAPGGQGSNSSGVLNFNGSSQYVQLNNLTNLSGTELTIEYWFKGTNCQSVVRQQNSSDYIVTGWLSSGIPVHILSFDGGTANGVRVDASGTSVIHDGQWHHVVMTWKKNEVNGFKSYLDGVLQAQRNSANVDIPNLNISTYLGRYISGTEYTNGSVDNIRIWNVARSEVDIQANMFLETPVTSTGLVAHYKFNGDFTCANNPAYNGTPFNAPTFAAANYYTFEWTGLNAPASSTSEVQTLTAAVGAPSLYTLTATAPAACTSPAASTGIGPCITASPLTATCPGETIELTAAGFTGSIQWQYAESGTNWQDIPGATTNPYNATIGVNPTWYRAVVTDGGDEAQSAPVLVNLTISASGFDLGIIGAPELTVGGTTSFCFSSPIPSQITDFPEGGEEFSEAGFRIHRFKTVGNHTFTVPAGFTGPIEVLVVAGGGGGGSFGGGGGAGGLVHEKSFIVSPGTYTVTVGAGGAGATTSDVLNGNGQNGGNSVFDSITALGGGGGGTRQGSSMSYAGLPGNAGGSGGGGANSDNSVGGAGGAGTYGQGFAGGAGGSGSAGLPNYSHGAGGGAGGPGMAGRTNGTAGAKGGVGLYFPQFAPWGGSPAGWFAGGGGGGVYNNGSIGLGGLGGGGNSGGNYGGVPSYSGVAGVANTGGGGGGGGHTYAGGAGGSGIVIIRYPEVTADGAWSSSNNAVATVDAGGVVTGVSTGTANIVYTAGIAGCSVELASVEVTVEPELDPVCVGGTIETGFTLYERGFGGTVTKKDGYKIHTFTNVGSDVFTSMWNGAVQVLVVAGGGGGGADMGGGGGGGGVIYDATYSISPGNIPVLVGAGGAGARARNVLGESGKNGGNSMFGSILAIGGGGGASWHDQSVYPAGSGGSGGGASGGAQAPNGGSGGGGGYGGGRRGTGIPGQGHDGAWGIYSWYPGGGGGAGGPGQNNPAHGGPGIMNDILGIPYYWGGGGGGSGYTGVGGNGGIGGGGGGAVGTTSGGAGLNNGSPGGGGALVAQTNTPGGHAGANTGGGGGGGAHYTTNNQGGDGGSGIVIVKYEDLPSGTFSSSNPAVASVDSSGIVTTYSAGTAIITYSVSFNGCSVVQTRQITVSSETAGTIAASKSAVCINDGTTITLSGSSGTSFQWQQSAQANGPWENVSTGSGATTAVYTTSSLTDPTWFRVLINGTCEAISNAVLVSTTEQPPVVQLPISGATSISVGATSTLCAGGNLPTGGTVTTVDGYRVHQFTTTGDDVFIVPQGFSTTAEILVVGGGGGGGSSYGGGGGAGGLVYDNAFTLTSGTYYPVSVGAGGAGSPAQNANNRASNGANSVFGSIIAYGGGGGTGYGPYNTASGSAGGSGGGGAYGGAGGAATPAGQGFSGGASSNASPNYGAGGGGGAGGAGGNGVATKAGNGGPGIVYSITGSPVMYASGGGGSVWAGGTSGTAYPGGGAGGVVNSPGEDGTPNTGGGGGGGYGSSAGAYKGGDGGSGTVIVRYLNPPAGEWISSNLAVATVDPVTGVVTGISEGTADITYVSKIAGCTVAEETVTITVNPPIAPLCINGNAITGIQAVPELPELEGGVVTTSGEYTIHKFLESGTLTVPDGFNVPVDVLVVGGGGGGGSDMGGGGGGGGVVYTPGFTISPGTIAVTVGEGGLGAPEGYNQPRGQNGGNSVFAGITALGGGGGGSEYGTGTNPAGSGASGGGAPGCSNPTAGLGTPGQGFNGGGGGSCYYPGGGGGAGGPGRVNPGHGGPGVMNNILGTPYYWGGGGGGAGYSGIGGNGGIGGGGGGAVGATTGGAGLNNGSPGPGGGTGGTPNLPGGNAGANTGGGGGGGSHYNLNNYGGNGGSGIVVVRYKKPAVGQYTSSNPSVATVDPLTGVVTGISAGSAVISYTLIEGSCTLVQTYPLTVGPGEIGTASVAETDVCTGTNTTISLSGDAGTAPQWQQSTDGITNWVNVSGGSGATSSVYTTPNLSQTTWYRLQTTNGTCTATSNAVEVKVNPQPPTVSLNILGVPSVSVNGTTALCAGGGLPSGGTVTSLNGYRIHTFTDPGDHILSVPVGFTTSAEVLVVAGGGGGGMDMGGGGGGGGVIAQNYVISSGEIPVTVGAGGTGAPAAGVNGQPTYHPFNKPATNGGNSILGTLIAIGGGKGGSSRNGDAIGSAGGAGGSGGGASGYNSNNVAPGTITGGAGTAGQGYAGGNQGNQYYSGGGGGAGGPGSSGNNRAHGGPGVLSDILGTPYYWGGGGGGAGYTTIGGNGGVGGGGGGAIGTTFGGAGFNNGFAGGGGAINAQSNRPGGHAGANTGGGGGGGSHYNSNNGGGNGGSGIVIVKYLDLPAGTWSSSNTSIATVDPNTGVVTGIAPGSVDITYTVKIGACTVVNETITVTVDSLAPICVDGTAFTSMKAQVNPTGGSVTNDGVYRVHTFTTEGEHEFTVPDGFNGNLEVLVVAGGGGGGSFGGGGGAGGLIYEPAYSISPGAYTVTVGKGGTGAVISDSPNNGINGTNSVFATLTAIGGGGGGTRQGSSASYAGLAGNAGGSGGGGANSNNTTGGAGGAATSGQGYAGGAGGSGTTGTPNYSHGGGGGAGGAGMNGKSNGTVGAAGGIGRYFPQFAAFGGSPAGWFAGGGGGGVYTNGSVGLGGNGGGGNGGGTYSGAPTSGANGVANTGGGGGGGGYTYPGGNGGSGIVIVRYIDLSGTWTSSNPSVATVDSTGLVTAVSPGTATITCTYQHGSCTLVQTAQITVSGFSAGTVTVGEPNVCNGNSTTITLSGNATSNLQWQQSPDGVNGWANVTGGSGANSTVYTTPGLTESVYYRVMQDGDCRAYSPALQVKANDPLPTISIDIKGVTSLPVNGTTKLCVNNAVPAGGTVTTHNGYRIHSFTNTGASFLTVPEGFHTAAQVLVVAGGGGGGSDIGGGGGGGGVVYNSNYVISGSGVPLYVGQGGSGAPAGYNQRRGSNGENSSFGSITAIGGGGGGSEYSNTTNPAGSGGSGGGAPGCTNATPGAGTPGQGYSGGGFGGCNYAGGGGGAGGPGMINPGHGGPGVMNDILGIPYYWGGGGGGSGYNNRGGNGGIGGGGGGAIGITTGGAGINNGAPGTNGALNTSANVPGGNGGANTGGGGGGGSHYNTNNYGGNGGSGIVIVKYLDLPTNGVWSSSNPAIATVNPVTGIVTGVAPGTVYITYTVKVNGCIVVEETTSVTVNPAVDPICIDGQAPSGIVFVKPQPALTGGTVTNVDGYVIHTFNTSGTLTVPEGFDADVELLVVGGGGGGGQTIGGGGGGGGVLYNPSYTLSPQDYTVVIGEGGNGAAGNCGTYGTGGGFAGGNSLFGSLVAYGGGGGGNYNNTTNGASSGASGGGIGAGNNAAVMAGMSGQGYAGGRSAANGNNGSGGGGAGGPGINGVNFFSGAGGPGQYHTISGTYKIYGGGGGGGARLGYGNGGAGGPGGGGAGGGGSAPGQPGVANTGGGGGGSGYDNTCYSGGKGGSGVVVLRYKDAPAGVFASSDESIATVDANGMVTGIAPGTVTITYTTNYGSCTSVQSALVTISSTNMGTVSPASVDLCPGSDATLSLNGNPGLSVQWQQSDDGINGWTNVSGGTGATTDVYQTPTLVNPLWYRALATGSCTSSSDPIPVTLADFPAVVTGLSPEVSEGSPSVSITYSSPSGNPDEFKIVFDGAAVAEGFVNTSFATLPPGSVTVSLPVSAAPGTYNAELIVRNSSNGCESTPIPFTITITSGCPGSNPGATQSTAVAVNAGDLFTLSPANITAAMTGITFQWQSSPNNSTWTNISGATTRTHTTSQTTSTWYRCVVTCLNGSPTGISDPVYVYSCHNPANTGGTFTQPFAAASLPSGWANTVIQGAGTQNWKFRSSPVMNSASGGNYAVFDDESFGAGVAPNEASLVTPSVNFLNRYNLHLSYYTAWLGVEFTHGYVEISVDGGSTWDLVKHYETVTTGTPAAPVQEILDISSWADNQCDVKVRFRYFDGNQAGKYWYIDDVNIYSLYDVEVQSLIAPGNLNCNQAYSSTQSVTVRIYNHSLTPTTNIPVVCQISGGINQTLNATYTGTPIPAQSFIDFTFPSTVNMSGDAAYQLKVYTNLSGDGYRLNDSITAGRRQLIRTYPYVEDFNISPGGWTASGQNPPNNNGRKWVYGSLPYLGGDQGYGNGWHIEATGFAGDYFWVESPVFDLSEMTNPKLSFDVKHRLRYGTSDFVDVWYSTNGGANWTRLGAGPSASWYNQSYGWWDSYDAPVSNWKHVETRLCELSGESCVKFRIQGYTYYGSPSYDAHYYFAFDNVSISDGQDDDIEVTQLFLPASRNCSTYTTTESLRALVTNNTCRILYNIPIQVSHNGGTPVTEIIPGPLHRFTSLIYNFTTKLNLSTAGTHTIEVKTLLPTDSFPSNDTRTETRFNSKINSYPYLADFDAGNEGWVSYSPTTTRYFKHDTLPYLNGPEGNGKSWFTKASGFAGDYYYVDSPVFDFSTITNPQLSFDIKHRLRYGTSDFVDVWYSTNGGTNWTRLGSNASPNWYTQSYGWWDSYDAPVSQWKQVQHSLCFLAGQSCVKFRIQAYTYYGTPSYESHYYFAFDNFSIVDGGDVGVSLYNSPVNNGCLYSESHPLTVRVFNNSCTPLTDVPVKSDITGPVNTTLTATVPGPIPVGGYVTFTFPTPVNMTDTGTYRFRTYTELPFDANPGNDTAFTTLTVKQIKVKTFPYFEDFNASTGYWIASGQNPPNNNGRKWVYGSLPYLGGDQGNGNSWHIEATGFAGDYFWVESPVFDLSQMTNPKLSFDVKHRLRYGTSDFVDVWYSINGGANWTRLGAGPSASWYNQSYGWWDSYDAPVSTWKHVETRLCELSGESCVKFRIQAYTYYGSPSYDAHYYFAFDNVSITDGQGDDIQVTQLFLPGTRNCTNYSATETVRALITNNTCRTLYNVPVQISHNGGTPVTEIIPGPLNRFSSITYNFATTLNLSSAGTHTIEVKTLLATDTFPANDARTETRFNSKINSFPYLATFDSGNEGWVSYSPNPSRYFRHDSLPYLNGPEGNGKSWYTTASGFAGDYYYVDSPIFDFSTITNPQLTFDIKHRLRYGTSDFVDVWYSTNGGTNWTRLGSNVSPNWYTQSYGWWDSYDAPVNKWKQVQHSLCFLAGQSCVRFRIQAYTYYGSPSYESHYYFAFDNFQVVDGGDVGVSLYNSPVTNGCLYTENHAVTVRVFNNSCTPLTNVPVKSDITGTLNTTLTGTVPGPIPVGSYVTYTFPATINMTDTGTYYFRTYTELPFDANPGNDTASTSITVKQITIKSYPYVEDFNTSTGYWIASGQNPPNNNGRKWVYGSLPYLGGDEGNGNGWHIEATGFAGDYFWVESPVFDLTGLSNPLMSFDIKHRLRYGTSDFVDVWYSTNGGANWTRLGSNVSPNWYNQSYGWWDSYDNPVSQWRKVQHNLCALAGQTCVKFRIQAYTYYGSPSYDAHYYFAFDNFKINDSNDAGVSLFNSPVTSGCLYTENHSVSVRVFNNNCTPLTNVPVRADITGALNTTLTGTVPGPIPVGSYVNYTFPTTVDLTDTGMYYFKAYTQLPGDLTPENDTSATSIRVRQIIVRNYPYVENFDNGTGYWISSGQNPPNNNGRKFVLGDLPYLNGSEGNGDSWYVEANGFAGDYFWVESPVFDFTGLTNPRLSFDIKHRLRYGTSDFADVWYSTNGGANWTRLGSGPNPNWYNQSYGWWDSYDAPVDKWTQVKQDLCGLAGQSCVKFRIQAYTYYGAPSYNAHYYFAFDNFMITDTPVDAECSIVYSCWGSEYGMDVTVKNVPLACSVAPTITSLMVHYTINGGDTISLPYTGLNITSGNSYTLNIPNTLIPDNATDVKVWVSDPNGLMDQEFRNDNTSGNSAVWPNCSDHCSNAIQLVDQVTVASTNNYATWDPTEDPSFSACPNVTLENTIWYYFTTDCEGLGATVAIQNINCFPSQTGMQLSIDRLLPGQEACVPSSYENVFCAFPTDNSDIIWSGEALPNTTYYITTDGIAGNQCTFEIVVTNVVAELIPAEEVEVEYNNTCYGIEKILKPVGGSTGATGQWSWYADSLFTEHLFTGDSLIVDPLPGVTTYWVRVENACDTSLATFVNVTTSPAPNVTNYFPDGGSTPAAFALSDCNGESMTFGVTAEGSSLLYQWEVSADNGASWSTAPLAAAPYSGAETNTLNISSVPANFDGNKYRVIISSTDCPAVDTSEAGQIRVATLPSISIQPTGTQACIGTEANFSSQIDASGIINYDWEVFNGTNWEPVSDGVPAGVTYSGNGTPNLSLNSVAGVTTPGYYAYRLKYSTMCNIGNPYVSDSVLLDIQTSGTWTGAVSSDWNVDGNWCGLVPTSSVDVVIPSSPESGRFPQVLGLPDAESRNLVLFPGASVTVDNLARLLIHGDFNNNGMPSTGAGTVELQGPATQKIGGSTATEFGSLVLNNSANGIALALESDISIADQLNLVNPLGKLDLNSHNIHLGATGTVLNEINSNRIFCGLETGEIKASRQLDANSSYPNLAGLGLAITTRSVAPGLTDISRGHAAQLANMHMSINRYFDIHSETNQNLNVSLGIGYFDDELGSGAHIESDLIPWRRANSGADWEGQFYPSRLNHDVATTTATNWITIDSVMAFSRWTLSDWNTEPLPVELLSFTAVPDYETRRVNLQWITASEVNCDYFTVERSRDAAAFEFVLNRDGAGNSNIVRVYDDIDANPYMGVSYYRLKQTDFNGDYSYSEIVPVVFNDHTYRYSNAWINENKNIRLVLTDQERGRYALKLFDAAGKLVLTDEMSTGKGLNNHLLYNPGLAPGIYMLRLEGEQYIHTHKLHIP